MTLWKPSSYKKYNRTSNAQQTHRERAATRIWWKQDVPAWFRSTPPIITLSLSGYLLCTIQLLKKECRFELWWERTGCKVLRLTAWFGKIQLVLLEVWGTVQPTTRRQTFFEMRYSKVEIVPLHQSSQGVMKRDLEIFCKKEKRIKFELFQWAKLSSTPGGGTKNEEDSEP